MAATIPYYTVADLEHFPNDGNRYELLDGVLLVTPAPNAAHQLLAARLIHILMREMNAPALAFVFGPGAVSYPPRTQLEPDVLVVPARVPFSTKWADYHEHWLAVEIYSPSSRIYDRDFKRDAYLALGVDEVWLVDLEDRSVDVERKGSTGMSVRDTIRWHVPVLEIEVLVDLSELFDGLE
ncbi:MAG: Uma2 family endonuclease [Gemmatimonadota bacterium]|nr:Uma2 family endonuclease [Gemmatimonadota bacterium]